MVPTAHQVRTSLVIGAAGATIVAALLATMRHEPAAARGCALPITPAGPLAVRLATAAILPGSSDQDIAVTITAPANTGHSRPALSLAIVIDRSGSMAGTSSEPRRPSAALAPGNESRSPIDNAKAAAGELIDELGASDAFSIVTYSSGGETNVGMALATPGSKAAAHAALDRIYAQGGTCISCGLVTGQQQLAMTPVTGGLQRMVLISDGRANEGIWNRDELARLATDTAAHGTSISTVGVGLDFDEQTMTRIAEVGRGNYYFVEDTRTLPAMFTRELGGLADTVARDVRLVVTEAPGTQITEAYGYPTTRQGSAVVVPVADLRAGETRKVVLHAHVAAPQAGQVPIVDVQLAWQRVDRAEPQTWQAKLVAPIVADAAQVAASADPEATSAIEAAHAASALEQASRVYETQGKDAARAVVEQQVQRMHANKAMPMPAMKALDKEANEVLGNFDSAAPAKAMKVGREKAYKLLR